MARQPFGLRADRMFDGGDFEDGPVTVVVEADRIIAVHKGATAAPPGIPVYHVPGGTLLPGFIDSHVHLSRDGEPDYMAVMLRESAHLQTLKALAHAWKTLRTGFTTVRTAGERSRVDLGLRAAIEGGVVKGPRVVPAGKVLSVSGGHRDGFFAPEVTYDGNSVIVNGRDAVRKAVRDEIKLGAKWVKLVVTGGIVSPTEPGAQQMASDEIKEATATAAALGVNTAAHAHGGPGVEAAIRNGVRTIEHGTYVDARLAELIRDNSAYLTPALQGTINLIEYGPDAGVAKFAVEKAKVAWESHRQAVAAAVAAETPILVGTDAGGTCVYHGENAREFELLVDCGVKTVDVLKSATSVAARMLGLDGEIGSVRAGALADLVVVAGDPRQNISNLRSVELVVKGGEIVHAADQRGAEAAGLQLSVSA